MESASSSKGDSGVIGKKQAAIKKTQKEDPEDEVAASFINNGLC